MKALRFYIIFIFLGIISSCHKKEYPKPEVIENTAVYYSRLTIDNKPVVLEAGVNGYYMYSSCKLDSNFVYGFIADLRKSDCSNCTNSLKIKINDSRVSLSGHSAVADSSLRNDFYPFLAGTPVASYSVQFSPVNSDAASYHWDFGDGTSSNEEKPVKTFVKEGKYTVCFTATSTTNYVSSICNKEKIDVSPKSCKTSINSVSSGNTINFTNITSGGQAPYQYLWNLGDGATSTLSAVSHTYKVRGSNAVSLRVVDAYGDTAYANYNAKTASDVSSYAVNYTRTSITRLPPNLALSQITITWVDEDGKVYSSNSPLQPTDSSFEVVSVSEGERNELGEPTKKITARFNCRLYNGFKSITVSDAEVVVCVAYK